MDPRHKGRVRKPKEYKAVLIRAHEGSVIFQEFESIDAAIEFQAEHDHKYLLIIGDIHRIHSSSGLDWI